MTNWICWLLFLAVLYFRYSRYLVERLRDAQVDKWQTVVHTVHSTYCTTYGSTYCSTVHTVPTAVHTTVHTVVHTVLLFIATLLTYFVRVITNSQHLVRVFGVWEYPPDYNTFTQVQLRELARQQDFVINVITPIMDRVAQTPAVTKCLPDHERIQLCEATDKLRCTDWLTDWFTVLLID